MKKKVNEKGKKDLNYYLNLDYPITIDRDEEDGKRIYTVEIPDLPGCSADGELIPEALKELEDAKKAWIGASLKRNLSIPEPIQQDLYSGKFLLRIPARLHMSLSKEAEKNNVSLNQYARNVLEQRETIQVVLDKLDELHKELKDIKDEMRTLQMNTLENQEQPFAATTAMMTTAMATLPSYRKIVGSGPLFNLTSKSDLDNEFPEITNIGTIL